MQAEHLKLLKMPGRLLNRIRLTQVVSTQLQIIRQSCSRIQAALCRVTVLQAHLAFLPARKEAHLKLGNKHLLRLTQLMCLPNCNISCACCLKLPNRELM